MDRERKRKLGRPGVTLEDVWRACKALDSEGRKKGPMNVRLQLGRGSYTTIIAHLRALGYAERRGSQSVPVESPTYR